MGAAKQLASNEAIPCVESAFHSCLILMPVVMPPAAWSFLVWQNLQL